MPKTKKTYSEIDEIREDLDSLRGNVVELTKHLKRDGLEQAAEVSAVAKERLGELKMNGRRQVKRIERQVKAKPAQSLAIAFATGIAASMLLRSRR